MRLIVLTTSLVLLTACSGGAGTGAAGAPAASSRNDLAAQACDAYAKSQLEEKTYRLDLPALAASMQDNADGTSGLRAPIVINPGKPGESKQTLECSVRFVDGHPSPDVMAMQFIW